MSEAVLLASLSVCPPAVGEFQGSRSKPEVSGLPQSPKGLGNRCVWSLSQVLQSLDRISLPFPAQVLGEAGGEWKVILLNLALKPLSNPLPSRAPLRLLKRVGSTDIPGLKPQLPDDQLCDLSK